jgi:hypothetical protein
MRSMSKTVTGTLVGIAIDSGLIDGVDVRAIVRVRWTTPAGGLYLLSSARFQAVSARSDGFGAEIMAPYTHYPLHLSWRSRSPVFFYF